MDYITSFHTLIDPSRFPIAVLALGLVAVVGVITGPMHANANPFLWMVFNKVFGPIGARLDRKERTKRDLLTRGLVFTIIVLLTTSFLSYAAKSFVSTNPLNGFTEVLLLSLALTSGTVWYSLLKLYFALKDSKTGKRVYYIVAHSSRTDLSTSDNYTITRTGMSYGVRCFDKGIVSPVIWYILAGLPGAYIYAALAWLSWRYGKDGCTKGFGDVPNALEKILGFAPAGLTAALIAFGGLLTPTASIGRVFRSLTSSEKRSPYNEGGLPLTALCYTLNVSLGGPRVDLDGDTCHRKWIGPENATAQLDRHHLRRALYLLLMAFVLMILALLSAMLYANQL